MAEVSEGYECCVHVDLAVVPGLGEDSFTFHRDAQSGFLCVADGCGGLGAKRYPSKNGHTGAYLASRLVTECVGRWKAQGILSFPQSAKDCEALCLALARKLSGELHRFEEAYASQGAVRIVGRMQRALPTTLCLALFQPAGPSLLDCLFLWAGDSRGYVLNAKGLHQLTADHVSSVSDALDSLYNDAPLQNMVNAEAPFVLSARGLRTTAPCVVITATDGAFAYLPTPMEFEWLLLSTLRDSASMETWQKKMASVFQKIAADDCTILMALVGYESFDTLKANMEARCVELQSEYITPVRRRRQRLDYAREKWEVYRKEYDWTEVKNNAELDWRV